MNQSNDGESLSRARRLPKRHNAKLCPFAKRQQIANALANGDSKRAIARALRVSNNTVTAIAEQEWQRVEARKAILANQAERNALMAGEQISQALQQGKVPIGSLVPVYGVSLDKAVLLRGEPSLTIHHEHTHSHQVELVQRFNAAMEKLVKAGVVEVPALPAETRNHSQKSPRKKPVT